MSMVSAIFKWKVNWEFRLKELSYGTLSYFGGVQTYLEC